MRYWSPLSLIIVLLISTNAVFSQQYQLHKKLNKNWYYLDDNDQHQSFAPSNQQQKIYLSVDKSFPEGAVLNMLVNSNTSIFIDGRIVDFASSSQRISYSMDSLFSVYDVQLGQLIVTLFNPYNISVKQTTITRPYIDLEEEKSIPVLRNNANNLNVLLIFVLTILVMFTYIKLAHAEIWKGYMKWSRILSLKDQGDAIYKIRPFEKGALIIVLGYTLISATAIFGLFYLSEYLMLGSDYFDSGNIPLLIFKWLGLVLFLFVLAYSKYILIKMFTTLFDFKGASKIHFYNHIKISIVIVLALLLTELILIFGFRSTLLDDWIPHVIIILLVLKSLLVSVKLIKISSYRLFHLFSYLCATELVPAIVLVKITFLT